MKFCAAALVVLSIVPLAAEATVKPAALFGDHMVLQSGMPVPVWGTAGPGEPVTVTFSGQRQSVAADAAGKWMVRLTDLQPGGPYEMTIAGANTITIRDVLVGEVWLGSGQSNMAFTVSKKAASYAGLVDEEKEIAAANYPKLRMFTGKSVRSDEPQPDLQGQWLVCTPETVPGFSAVAYLFGRNLHKELDTPVGMLVLAYGASTAEAWLPRETMAADPLLKPMLDGFDAAVAFYRKNPQAPGDQAPAPPQTINARPGPPPRQQRDPVQDQHQPTVLFNGMIHPAIPYAIRGVIWYQGESIVGGDAGVTLYPHVQNAVVTEWRKLWGEGDFPFYVVQLAAQANISNNPRVREGQAAVLSLPNTGIAVTIDIGDEKDVHPHNKEPLGDRLTLIALANVYHRQIEFSGPVYESMSIERSAIRLKFSHLGGGLVAKGGPLKWFQVAGADRKFVDADARLDGDTIVVSRADVTMPQAVRYAWDNYPEGCNLYNAAGLPSAPFRTDKW
ncbi:MAG: sialate O-acetylesterase [Bryobacteraceae bacterium]